MKFVLKHVRLPLVVISVAFCGLTAFAQTFWTGTSGTDTNWSNGNNWSPATAPDSADTVFQPQGAVASPATVNNFMDRDFTLTSLLYTNSSATTSNHVTLIADGRTLTINNGLTVYSTNAANSYNNVVIKGNGTLSLTGGNLQVAAALNNTGARMSTLNLSGLNVLNISSGVSRVAVGCQGLPAIAANNVIGTLYLAKTNVIVLSATGAGTAFLVGSNNNASIGSVLYLGQTNGIFADAIQVGQWKASGCFMTFQNGLVSPTAYFRNNDMSSRVSFWGIATAETPTANGSSAMSATNDFTGGSVDAQVQNLNLGITEMASGTTQSSTAAGTLTFNAGTIDVNQLTNGWTRFAAAGAGTINVNGTATLKINNLGVMAAKTGTTNAFGNLNINGGSVQANSLIAGGGTITVAVNSGSLSITTNAFGSTIAPLSSVSITNATLTLPGVSIGASITTTNFNAAGTTNVININNVPVLAGYPATIPIIKYSAGTVAPNIGLGTLPAASPVFKGYITNDPTALSVNLILTNGPQAARILTWIGSAPSPDWDLDITANWKTNGGLATTYHDQDFVRFDDSGVTNFVNLAASPIMPTSMTVSNLVQNYTIGGGGYLSGSMSLIKQGTAKLIFDNNGNPNDFAGTISISNGVLQIGNGDQQGNVGGGPVVNNGSIVFDRTDTSAYNFSNSISGSGSLTVATNGVIELSGANTFSGAVTVAQGTLLLNNINALGSTNGGTTINSGARLDVGGPNLAANVAFSPESIIVSGVGPDTNGAIVNNGSVNQQNALLTVTLAGDTTFGGSSRFDIRGTGATLSTQSQPYSLIKTGANEVVIVDATVDPALNNIDIQQGQLQFQGNVTSLGNPASTLFVRAGASLFINGATNAFNKNISLTSDGSTLSVQQTGGSSTITGPMTLNSPATLFSVANGATSLTLNNTITGAGGITQTTGTNTLIMAGPAKAYTGPTLVNVGKLQINTTLAGPLTNASPTTISGNGTNSGPVEIDGTLAPGATAAPGVVGTFTAASGLTTSGTLNMDFGSDPNSVSNDLIQVTGGVTINGGSVNINPMGLLKIGQPYHLIKYTGTLNLNSDFTYSSQNNYSFATDTTTPGQVNVIASGGPSVWNGGSPTDNFWSDAANWGNIGVSSGQTLFFANGTRLVNTNDEPIGNFYGLDFDTSASSFTLYGNPINVQGNIVSTSPNPQKVNLDLTYTASGTNDGGAGGLTLGGNITNAVNGGVITFSGTGTVSNKVYNSDPSITNVTLAANSSSANWTLMDNSTSTAQTNAYQFNIQGGSFSIGNGASAPVMVTTSTINTVVGSLANVPATFTVNSGNFTMTGARFNTGTAANSIANINVNGGTFDVQLMQCADGSASASSTENFNGGTAIVGDPTPATFFVSSRGTGVVNVASSAVVLCGTLDVERGISSSITGVVNLNGGTLGATSVGTGTSSASSGTTGSTGTVNFNGGVLKARASSTTFFQGRAATPTIPLLAIVKTNGAFIDSDSNTISFLEPLQHDSTIGATPDGGLTKKGPGTLTVTAVSTYTGPTMITNGTLLVNGTIGAGSVAVAPTGTLGGTGTVGGAVTVNGTIAPGISSTNIGVLTVQAGVNITGTNSMKLDKGNATNDVLVVNGTLNFGGSVLNLTNLTGTLAASDSFQLYRATAYAGAFGSIVPATPGANLTWDTSSLGTLGILRVAAAVTGPTTNANITKVTLSGTNVLVHGTNNNVPNTSFHYVVLTTPNITNALSNWTPVVTNPFNPDGTFDYTNPIVPGTPRQFIDVEAVP
jgi:fibronectin-binding autotransporter adhesin